MRITIRKGAAFPAHINSDAGVVLSVHRTPGGVVVDAAEVVVASASTHVSPGYDNPEAGEVYVVAPRVYGCSRASDARRAWRDAIVAAVVSSAGDLPALEDARD